MLTGYQDGYNFSPNQVYAAVGDIIGKATSLIEGRWS
jgi:hypothetical protein